MTDNIAEGEAASAEPSVGVIPIVGSLKGSNNIVLRMLLFVAFSDGYAWCSAS
ncbi:MAG: hypothetical protein ACKVRN_16225 [Pyrinomonadaceae bacterium]